MPEMVLPGVYIDVRAEALIAPGRVTVGNVGLVGTASKGPVNVPTLLTGIDDARRVFGAYDEWKNGKSSELTLARALELGYQSGANTVFAVRVGRTAALASATFEADGETAGTKAIKLIAASDGTWGNDLGVNVWDAEDGAFIEREAHPAVAPPPLTLARKPAESGRNRVSVLIEATGLEKEFEIVKFPAPAAPGKVQVNFATGDLAFAAADGLTAADTVFVTYVVPTAQSRKVTLRYGTQEEVYTVADGKHLEAMLKDAPSQLARGDAGTAEIPKKSAAFDRFDRFGKPPHTAGSDGAGALDTDYKAGLDTLLNEPVHVVVAAGMDDTQIADELKAHCDKASTDKLKADRIAVVGSRAGSSNLFEDVRSHRVNSDRLIFVAPGFKATDAVSGRLVTFPGSMMAAVIAGMLSGSDPHVSLTNKAVPVGELEQRFDPPQLEQLVLNRVFAIEDQRGRGIRVTQALTTDPGPFRQVTTRRIVDFAKYGVRSAASPYIGRLNNERVRAAMKVTISSFLQEMLDDEMITMFSVEVKATREDEIKGIANVTIVLQPTFSIDYIKVTMFLQ